MIPSAMTSMPDERGETPLDHAQSDHREHAPFADALSRLAVADPRLAPVIAATGPLPERQGRPGFEGLASVIVSQLVSRQSAEAIWRRLVASIGPLTHRAFLAAGAGVGPRLGLTAAKADTLYRIAAAIDCGTLDLDALARLPAQDAIARLLALKGVGLWTAEVHLLFNAGHADIFPAGDLALRAAYAHAFGVALRPSVAVLKEQARTWAPERSTAARLLWAYYGRVVRPGPSDLP